MQQKDIETIWIFTQSIGLWRRRSLTIQDVEKRFKLLLEYTEKSQIFFFQLSHEIGANLQGARDIFLLTSVLPTPK